MVLGLWLVLLLGGCQSTANGARLMATQQATTHGLFEPGSELARAMVFRVGNKIITGAAYSQKLHEEVGPLMQQWLAQGKTRLEVTELAEKNRVRQRVLDQYIQEELLLWLADQQGVDVDAGKVAESVERQRATSTPEELIRLRAKEVRQQRVLTMIARHTKADQFHARHILFEVHLPMTATQQQRQEAFAQAKSEAEAVLNRLQAGADFAQMARDYSDDRETASKGGDLGWAVRGTFLPNFETVVLSETLPLRTPVLAKTSYGYHIVEVLDRKFNAPFDSVEHLRGAHNLEELINTSFMPWYDALEREMEAEGVLEINPAFDLRRVPLPFPTPSPTLEATPTPFP